MKTKILPVKSKTWSKFQPYLKNGICSNNAFPSSTCYGLFVFEPNPVIASMVWYTFPFYHTTFRDNLLPELRGTNKMDGLAYLNQNVRLLARISTLPKYRGNGFAFELVRKTIYGLGVKYVECLTAHDDVRNLLMRLAFNKVSGTKDEKIDYWLWTKKM